MTNINEIWKPIPGFVGYEVSSIGRVRSFWDYSTGNGRGARVLVEHHKLMRLATTKAGYQRVMLGRFNARSQQFVHRLVLMAFIGDCPDGMCACHNNGNRTDNRIDNLRWDTFSENSKDVVSHGNHKSGRGIQKNAKLDEDAVREIRATIGQVPSRFFAEAYGCSRQLVDMVRRGEIWDWVE